MDFLLDTSAYVHLTKGDDKLLKILSKASIVYVCPTVIGELHYAFLNSSKYSENLKMFEEFCSEPKVHVVNTSPSTAKIFGELKYDQSKKGKTVAINDLWIAAEAKNLNARLVTYDTDFLLIANLDLIVL